MSKISAAILLLLFVPLSFGAPADKEISHLLAYVQSSNCIFIRNGKEYSAEEALEHINEKYQYFEDEIETAENFIDLSASKSTISGKPYLIQCQQAEVMPSRDWLLLELSRYRRDANTPRD